MKKVIYYQKFASITISTSQSCVNIYSTLQASPPQT